MVLFGVVVEVVSLGVCMMVSCDERKQTPIAPVSVSQVMRYRK